MLAFMENTPGPTWIVPPSTWLLKDQLWICCWRTHTTKASEIMCLIKRKNVCAKKCQCSFGSWLTRKLCPRGPQYFHFSTPIRTRLWSSCHCVWILGFCASCQEALIPLTTEQTGSQPSHGSGTSLRGTGMDPCTSSTTLGLAPPCTEPTSTSVSHCCP